MRKFPSSPIRRETSWLGVIIRYPISDTHHTLGEHTITTTPKAVGLDKKFSQTKGNRAYNDSQTRDRTGKLGHVASVWALRDQSREKELSRQPSSFDAMQRYSENRGTGNLLRESASSQHLKKQPSMKLSSANLQSEL